MPHVDSTSRMPGPGEQAEARLLTDEARDLAEAGDLPAAAERFEGAYRLCPSPFRASRLLHCLRKQSASRARDAVAFGQEAIAAWPDDLWVRRECVWALYDGHLKGAEAGDDDDHGHAEAGDTYRGVIEAVETILDLTTEELPVKLAVLAACKVARRHGRWSDVLALIDRLSPEALAVQPQVVDGRTVTSDRERWYIAKSRALFELRRYREARELCIDAFRDFPASVPLLRVAALCLLEAGDAARGLEELEIIVRKSPPQWYLFWDLGRATAAAGRGEDARRWLVEAAQCPGDFRGRIGVFEDLAKILETLRQFRPAYEHLVLAWAIASAERWAGRAARDARAIEDFLANHEHAPGVADLEWLTEPPPVGPAHRRCREFWRAATAAVLPTGRGTVKSWSADKKYGFVRATTGADLFFLGKQYRGPGQPRVGMVVEFEIKDSYDPKKQRESQMAINVRPAGEGPPQDPAPQPNAVGMRVRESAEVGDGPPTDLVSRPAVRATPDDLPY